MNVGGTFATLTVDLNACARCHRDHRGLEFQSLTYPVPDPDGDLTHWAPCPVNGEPILLRVLSHTSEEAA